MGELAERMKRWEVEERKKIKADFQKAKRKAPKASIVELSRMVDAMERERVTNLKSRLERLRLSLSELSEHVLPRQDCEKCMDALGYQLAGERWIHERVKDVTKNYYAELAKEIEKKSGLRELTEVLREARMSEALSLAKVLSNPERETQKEVEGEEIEIPQEVKQKSVMARFQRSIKGR